jgi:hypothetical protein
MIERMKEQVAERLQGCCLSFDAVLVVFGVCEE